MRLWRLVHPKHSDEPLSGEGARLHGGRWNRKGQRVVYASTSPALAILELLVHVDASIAPDKMLLVEIALPDDLPRRKISIGDLPNDWARFPVPPAARAFGETWIDEAASVALQVPSAVLSHGQDHNVILNVDHPDFGRIRETSRIEIDIDPRLVRAD